MQTLYGISTYSWRLRYLSSGSCKHSTIRIRAQVSVIIFIIVRRPPFNGTQIFEWVLINCHLRTLSNRKRVLLYYLRHTRSTKHFFFKYDKLLCLFTFCFTLIFDCYGMCLCLSCDNLLHFFIFLFHFSHMFSQSVLNWNLFHIQWFFFF